MSPPVIPGEAEKLARLRRMKRLPLALLALMAALFVVTLHRPEAWAGWVNAFSEAGMIGALADWFAVVALFRHPLGIPIPHTAIIPRRKDDIGETMARFVADHFLHPDVVRAKLESVNLAAAAAGWLQSQGGRERVVDLAATLLQQTLKALHEERVREFIARIGSRQLLDVNPAPLLGRALDWLIQGGRHEKVLTQSLRFAVVVLHDNRETIRGNVQRESPWWLPGFIDDRIVKEMLDRIETLLLEMSLNPEHPMRIDFNDRLQGWAEALKHSPEMARWGAGLRQNLLDNEDLQNYFYALWTDLASGLERDLAQPESGVRHQLDSWVANWAEEVAGDEDMQRWLNGWLVESAIGIVDRNRHSIASLISDTVKGWNAEDTSYRVELAIGSDLQYIRINGTLVGGLVGVVLYALV